MTRVGALLLAAALIAASCGSGGSEPSEEAAPATAEEATEAPDEGAVDAAPAQERPADAIVIGAVLSTTGLMQPIEQPALLAAQQQVAQLNAAGGILGRPVVIEHVNGRSRMSDTFGGARQLVDQGASVLLVSCDAEFARPAIEVANEAGVLTLSPCGSGPRWSSGEFGDLAFSMGTVATTEGQLMAEIAREAGLARAITLTDENSPETIEQCRSFAEHFGAMGGVVATSQAYVLPTPERLEEPLTAILELSPPPDVVALCGLGNPGSGGAALAQLRAAGINALVISGSTMDGDAWLVDAPVPGDFRNLSYASVHGDDPSDAVRSVLDAYESAAGVPASDGRLVTGADAIQALAQAAETAGSVDGQALAAALDGLQEAPLVTGPTSFDAATNVVGTRPVRVIEMAAGSPRFVELRTLGGQ